MKKLLAAVLSALLVIVMSVVLVACGDSGTVDEGNNNSTNNEQNNSTNNDDKTETPLDKTISDASKVVSLEGHKLYLVNIGQSTVYDTVEGILKESLHLVEGTDYIGSPQLTAADVSEGDVVILATAASSKGMGSAGTDGAKELQRAKDFAAKQGIKIIVMQTNGASGRGDSSDPYFEALCPHAHLTLAVSSANSDKKFSNTWCPAGTLYLYGRASQMADSLKFVLGK